MVTPSPQGEGLYLHLVRHFKLKINPIQVYIYTLSVIPSAESTLAIASVAGPSLPLEGKVADEV